MNKVVLTGNLTRDVELREVGENKVARFGLAVRGFKKDETHFFDVEAWGKTGEFVSNYFSKGSFAILSGRLKQETWEKDGNRNSRVVIVAEEVDFGPKVDGGGDKQEAPKSGAASGKSGGSSAKRSGPAEEEDIF